MASHISWLTALRFSGWLKMIQPSCPSFFIWSLSVMRVSLLLSLHHEAAVHAEGLAGHVARAWRGEEADHRGDVFRRFHPSERHRRLSLPRELFGSHAEQCPLLARDLRPHVGLHEARADAVDADAVGAVREREALRHADDGRLAHVVGEVRPAADLAGHGCEADD